MDDEIGVIKLGFVVVKQELGKLAHVNVLAKTQAVSTLQHSLP